MNRKGRKEQATFPDHELLTEMVASSSPLLVVRRNGAYFPYGGSSGQGRFPL